MLEDKILVQRFNRGSRDGLRGIYERYKDDLLGLAVALLNDVSLAEDVVHDVFVSFGLSAGTFHLTGSLKSYLSTCVANCARDYLHNGKADESERQTSADAVCKGYHYYYQESPSAISPPGR